MKEERGSVFVLAAVLIPFVFLVLVAGIVDTGIWFTHKRQLQNRADAGALAAGVQYAANWAACARSARIDYSHRGQRDRQRGSAIRRRSQSGDKVQHRGHRRWELLADVENQRRDQLERPGRPRRPRHELERSSWKQLGPLRRPGWRRLLAGWRPLRGRRSSGEGRTDGHGHVRVQPLPQRSARSRRVENRRSGQWLYSIGGTGQHHQAGPDSLLPGVRHRRTRPTQDRVDIHPLSSDYQKVSGTTLWGPTVNDAVGGTPTGVQIDMPESTACSGDYIPVSTEVRVVGVDSGVVDINDPRGCSYLANPNTRFADCWSRVSNIRDFKDDPRTQPWFQEVTVNGGSTGDLSPRT